MPWDAPAKPAAVVAPAPLSIEVQAEMELVRRLAAEIKVKEAGLQQATTAERDARMAFAAALDRLRPKFPRGKWTPFVESLGLNLRTVQADMRALILCDDQGKLDQAKVDARRAVVIAEFTDPVQRAHVCALPCMTLPLEKMEWVECGQLVGTYTIKPKAHTCARMTQETKETQEGGGTNANAHHGALIPGQNPIVPRDTFHVDDDEVAEPEWSVDDMNDEERAEYLREQAAGNRVDGSDGANSGGAESCEGRADGSGADGSRKSDIGRVENLPHDDSCEGASVSVQPVVGGEGGSQGAAAVLPTAPAGASIAASPTVPVLPHGAREAGRAPFAKVVQLSLGELYAQAERVRHVAQRVQDGQIAGEVLARLMSVVEEVEGRAA